MDLNRQTRLKFGLARLVVAGLLVVGVVGTSIAGIQGSGIRMMAVGRMTAAGGVVVNGVSYDATGAQILIDGRATDASGLKTGHVVTVTGTIDAGGRTGTAVQVSLVNDVRGEITAVDIDAGAVSVLGQTVRITEETLMDARIYPAGIAGLSAGMAIEVSGFADANGDFIASRVDIDTETSTAQVRGTVSAVDVQGRSLRLNALDVDYSGATIEGSIAEGAIVTVQGIADTARGTLVANHIQVFAGLGAASAKGDLEGIITMFASSADFEVNGQPIVADARTTYVLRGVTLNADVAVHVAGRFDASGVLVADMIETRPTPAVAPGVVDALTRTGSP